MEFSGKMTFKTILKVRKNRALLSLSRNYSFRKTTGGVKLTPATFFRVKIVLKVFTKFFCDNKYQIIIIKLLKEEFLQKKPFLARCFSMFYFGILNHHAFKPLVKILLAEIFEALNCNHGQND